MAFQMTATQQVAVTIAPVDKKGNEAPLDGPPSWTTDNSDVVALEPSADGLTCTVLATGQLGTANVQVTGDADLGAGVVAIMGTLQVLVVPGQAVVIQVIPGTATERA